MAALTRRVFPAVLLFALLQCSLLFIFLFIQHTVINTKWTLGSSILSNINTYRIYNVTLLDNVQDWEERSSSDFHPSHVSIPSTRRGKSTSDICPDIPWQDRPGVFNLQHDNRTYSIQIGNLTCALHGIQHNVSAHGGKGTVTQCPCIENWSGPSCSIPGSVTNSNLPKRFTFTARFGNPRRIIQAFPFNMEFEMLEARLTELGDLVDVFLILESNYTAYGDPKPLRLLNRLREGQYRKYACKIVHIFLDYFPNEAHKDGWIEDDLLRNYITQHALPRQLSGYNHDDIFILTDADEIPQRETILFLKLHDGYPEPFGFNLQWNVYGFFWKANAKGITHVYSGVTMGMLTHVFENRAINIRSAPHFIHNAGARSLTSYLKHGKHILVYPWSFGNLLAPAGWHCSWCCNATCIQNKLISAQNGDFPRWGDFPEKRELKYIESLVKRGVWFDEVSKMVCPNPMTHAMYAPKYLMENKNKYSHILLNPFVENDKCNNKSL